MPRPRLLALDLDGTLMQPGGTISARSAEAVTAARDAGVEVVICTGRRFRTTAWVLEALGLDGPVVVHNGVLTKSGATGETLAAHYLTAELFEHALGLLRRVAPPIVYVDRYHQGLDMVVEPPETAHAYQATYLADYEDVHEVVPRLDDQAHDDVVMMSLMADHDALAPLREGLEHELHDDAHTNFLQNKSYEGYILEVTSRRASKWMALAELAAGLGIEREEIVAIGDDRNDASMIAGAGLGIAMGNAVDEVKAVADETTAANDAEGVALAIERFVLQAG
jgi:hypothetical protein